MRVDLELVCPFCAKNYVQHNGKNYINEEHVPPKCLFIHKRDKHGLITIPSCKDCNQGTSIIDEKFKINLGIYLESDSEDKEVFYGSMLRTLNHKPSWRNEILSKISDILLPYNRGYGHPIALDSEVLYLGARKIIRGLHWRVTGEVLPASDEPTVKLLEQGSNSIKLDAKTREIFDEFGKVIEKCGDIFKVVYAVPVDCKSASMWLISFYGENVFLGFTHPSIPIEKQKIYNLADYSWAI